MKNFQRIAKDPKGAATPKGSNAKALEAIASPDGYTKGGAYGKQNWDMPAAPDLVQVGNSRTSPIEPQAGLAQFTARQVRFRDDRGRIWAYRGKRGRVLAMLSTMGGGMTQWDTLPWHTRLSGSIHAMREDGLDIETVLEGENRHARYWLRTAGTLIQQGDNRPASRMGSASL